jgi:hypothetical protein
MIISVINLTKGKFSDEQVLRAIRAINRQIKEDFEPYWGFGGTLRLEGHSNRKVNADNVADMRGDAILFLSDKAKEGEDGSHGANDRGIPHGVVYLHPRMTYKMWTLAFSHEALELVADPEVNLLTLGPHPDPKEKGRPVFHWYEMCDAVQEEMYEIDGVTVSNFVLPLYFTSTDEFDGRNDFLGTINGKNSTLKSFGVNPGGYINYYDPTLQEDCQYYAPGDKVAAAKVKLKKSIAASRMNSRTNRRKHS